jgi:DNA replication protein DnaC
MTNPLINDYLKRLRLPVISKSYQDVANEAKASKASFEDYLCCLLELEVQSRDASNRKQRLTEAKFPVQKTLDTFKFEEIPNLDKSLILKLFKGQYLTNLENIVFIGGQGTGKTHLAIALGIEACNGNKRVKYFSTADLIHQLLEARDEKHLLKFQDQLLRYNLLILDELGLNDSTKAYSDDGSRLLFQVISSRYERSSTIITSNLEFDEWNSVFGTQKLTAALLDRVTHRCHIVNANGESYRFKESMRRKKKGQDLA